ncbi:551_t:CDS:1, partial [Funneliformis mosseae]
CNGKLVDPKTKLAYSKKSIVPIVPRRKIKESTNPFLSVTPLFSLEDLMDISDKEPQKS